VKPFLNASVLGLICLGAVAAPDPGGNPFDGGAAPPATAIDRLVFARLKQLGIPPADICSDAVFVRRVHLDVVGTLPSAFEARQFLRDRTPDKRRALIDRLLERDEFSDYWAMKWSERLRVKAEFPINLWPNAAQAYHHWIRTRIRQNQPCDQWVRELLTASGSNFRVPPVNFYRAMQNRDPAGIAQAVALTFMGCRAEQWPSNQLAGMAAFFAQVGYKSTAEWKEEIVFFEPGKDTNGLARAARFPDGTSARLAADRDPREVFADWLVDPKNPWFTRNLANRVWAWLLGRGIIQEPDDIRRDNPPANPALLAYLETELIASKYELKPLLRQILNSETYQLSCLAKSDRPEAAANFAFYPLRRLDAEVLIDALNQITGTSENYSSAIPEPFTFIPESQRAVALEDGSISSAFLEMFGRPARDTGLESERNNRATAEQRLHLLNSSHIQNKIEQSRMLQFQTQSQKNPREMATGIYLGILSRLPTPEELEIVDGYFQRASANPRQAAADLAWALVNSAEFLYRH